MMSRHLHVDAQTNFFSSSATRRISNTAREQHREKFVLSATRHFRVTGSAGELEMTVHVP